MDVFEFRRKLVADYSAFTRSFTRIKAPDIEALVRAGGLHPECAHIFRAGKSASSVGVTLTLFKHQEEAISFAQSGESYVLTTGTGSGKSLAYFIPVIDAVLKAKADRKSVV